MSRTKSDPVRLSDEQKRAFVRDGYVILRAVVPSELIETALSFVEDAYEAGSYKRMGVKAGGREGNPQFERWVRKAPQITDLMFRTGLHEAAESLLGEGNVTVRGELGQVAMTAPSEVFIEQGMSKDERGNNKRWHIDASADRSAKLGTDYSFMVGVALTEGQEIDENRGQLNVWPGSHTVTHAGLRDVIMQRKPTGDDDERDVVREYLKNKPDIGSPVRVLLRQGDAVIAHQRLAHIPGVNLCQTTRTNVYFRVSHGDNEEILEQMVMSPTPWVGFEGLRDFLPPGVVDAMVDDQRDQDVASSEKDAREATREIGHRLVLTREQKEEFVREGFLVLRDAVPMELVDNALDFADKAYENNRYNLDGHPHSESKKGPPGFNKPVRRGAPVMDLLYKSGLFGVAEQVLGEDNVTIRNGVGQVAYTEASEEHLREGRGMKEPHKKNGWHIDAAHGKYSALGSDFSFLVGVCLSDGQQVDENRGQFTVWPRSHLITHAGVLDAFNTVKPHEMLETFKQKKLDVGLPQRVLLRPGDALLAHQRLAHAAGINLHPTVRKNVYFRVIHAQFDDVIESYVRSPTPWVGFDGLRDVLPPGAVEWSVGGRKARDLLSCSTTSPAFELSKEQKRDFARDGYIILRGMVDSVRVERAKLRINKAVEKGRFGEGQKKPRYGTDKPARTYKRGVRRALDITQLLFETELFGACEALLGKGEAMLPEGLGEILELETSELLVAQGMDKKEAYPQKEWRVDHGGGGPKSRVDYNLVVVVALSAGQEVDENRGQLVIWPGSHVVIQRALAEIFRETSPEDVAKAFRKRRSSLVLAPPQRVLLRAGDALIAHQRLATAHGVNLTPQTRVNVHFHVAHAQLPERHDKLVRAETPFVCFDGLGNDAMEAVGEDWKAEDDREL